MCILSYLAPGVDVDTDGLFNGGISNPHGHGWAITGTDYVHVGKSMDLMEALDGFEAARKANPGGHALFHSRWATHGSQTTANVHPFYVGGQGAMTVVGHNGILPSSAHPGKGDDRSDTRLFADEILSTRYRRLDKKRARQALTDWIGSYNKLVILTVNPRYSQNAYIVNEKAGNWDTTTGLWHSNYDYLDMPYTRTAAARAWPEVVGRRPSHTRASAAFYEECYLCGFGAIGKDGFCDECGSCEDCLEVKGTCQCFGADTLADDMDANLMAASDTRLAELLAEEDTWLAELAAEQANSQHDYS